MAEEQDAAVAVRMVVRNRLNELGRSSQRQLADALGVRAQTVTKWLSGENRIPQWRWLEVERALGLTELTLARAAGLEIDLKGEDLALQWAQLYPPPTTGVGTELLEHLQQVERAMSEGRPIPRPPLRIGELRNRLVHDIGRLSAEDVVLVREYVDELLREENAAAE